MAEDTVNSQEELPTEITDEEADKLFENGGEPVAEVVEEVDTTQEEKDLNIEQPQAKEEKKEEPKVNLGALHEERAKRKELESKVKMMEDRFNQILQSQQKQAEPQLPSLDEDPITNFDTRLQQQEQINQQLLQSQQQQALETQVIDTYRAHAQQFVQQAPDFTDAYNYLIKGRVEELKLMGYDETTAQQAVKREEFGIAYQALQQGRNPAEMLHSIAKQRGWQSKPQQPQAVQKDLKVIEKGQQKSIPSGGGAPKGELTLEALAEMDDDEFNAHWEKMNPNKF